MKYNFITIIITIIFSFTIAVTYYINKDSPAIKYFPIDRELTFSTYETKLQLLSQLDADEYDIEWKSKSELAEPIYLRQDVSLLYANGRLKGMLSKWKENEKNIELTATIHSEDSSHFQSVAFHHGEVHYPDDEIKSIHAMSQDEIYVIDSPHSALQSFEQPTNPIQKEWKHTLDHTTNQQLSYHWSQLLKYFSIPQKKYNLIPLTNLHSYQDTPLPGLTQEETDKIIGQLWEGLYKNYILEISTSRQPVNSFVPLILFDKQNTHLMVLFQDQQGEKQQLIQHYSPPDS